MVESIVDVGIGASQNLSLSQHTLVYCITYTVNREIFALKKFRGVNFRVK